MAMYIEANALNMCPPCIASEVNVTDGIETQCELVQCRSCLRFHSRGKTQHYSSNAGAWLECAWESRDLMALCLKNIPGLHKVKLVDAGFIWTEPHAKRIKLRVSFQREVENHHAHVQSSCVITFTLQSMTCPDCTKTYHDTTWKALVQLRQKVPHPRTLLRLEQTMLQHKAHEDAINMTAEKEGLDFYFATKASAERLLHFLSTHAPVRSKASRKLVSENVRNATANVQLTYSVELSPICKDDLLVLPAKVAQSCRNIAHVTLCARTTSMVHLVDPLSGQTAELATDRYWKFPFLPLATSVDMIEFIVLDVEPLDVHELRHVRSPLDSVNESKSKMVLADVEVARTSDFGVSDTTFHVRTHLGGVLSAGDTVKGYDLASTVFGTRQTYTLKQELPDVVLVRKVYPREQRKLHKLKTLNVTRRGKVSKAERARREHEMEIFTEEYLEEEAQAHDENEAREHAPDTVCVAEQTAALRLT
ncbi:hypothetical protein PsorP6_013497 [Peronosclerospora sorghi]|uniref:Uncharacterized protein n=1 Tax=Peronosclerospora sorghi TaxID=230839 RepID=A0ACC0VGY7_9STRA|nr:hypothetical protein PsorP6_013497 [Peronosclerospora sorghi]